MRNWGAILCRVTAGAIYLLTSLYCLLAYIPYTYLFVVKALPFAWLAWFVRLHALLYWVAFAACVIAMRRSRLPGWLITSTAAIFAAIGAYVSATRMLAHVPTNWMAFAWAIIFLVPVFLVGIEAAQRAGATAAIAGDENVSSYITVRSGILIGCAIAMVSIAAADLRIHTQGEIPALRAPDMVVRILALLAHVFVGITVVFALNGLQSLVGKTPLRSRARRVSVTIAVAVPLAFALAAFLRNSLTLRGDLASFYAMACAAAVSAWLLLIIGSVLPQDIARADRRQHLWRSVALLLTIGFGIAAPSLIGELDWNGIVGSATTILVWIMLAACVYVAGPRTRRYWATVSVLLLTAAFAFYGTRSFAFSHAATFDTTSEALQGEIALYAEQNSSFGLLQQLLEPDSSEPCDGTCGAMKQYSQATDIELKHDIDIAAPLTPTALPKPNIFIIVLDSVRADYVGAYNPRVDFTPNLDAFAKDSLLLRNAYAHYSGTSLSEPSIWTGALLPQFEYPRPFTAVNSLERMARTDGYQLVVTWDDILSKLFRKSDDILKLDTDKHRFGQVELSSTLKQFDAILDKRNDPRPIMFYTQAMNVQMHAENDLPKMSDTNWRKRSGFNNRIAYTLHQADAILGEFFADLKQRGLYDNSIIVVTADHGDATGEFGRLSHSTIVYPEVMKVPLILHLPASLRGKYVFDENRLAALTDITPTIYYVLGHRPVTHNMLFGMPVVAETREELQSYTPHDLFLASDMRPIFGLLSADRRFFYTHGTTPPKRMLFDLNADPNAQRNLANDTNSKAYDERILEYLHEIAQMYGFKYMGG